MISRDEFLGKVRLFIEEQTGTAGRDIGWDDDLLGDKVVDSLIYVEFLYFLLDLHDPPLTTDELPEDPITTIEEAFRVVSGGRE